MFKWDTSWWKVQVAPRYKCLSRKFCLFLLKYKSINFFLNTKLMIQSKTFKQRQQDIISSACWGNVCNQHDWTTCDALTLDISQSSWWTREVSGGMQIYSNSQKLNLGTGSSSNLRENESEWVKNNPKKVTSAFCLFLSCWPRSLVSLYLCPPQCLGPSYLYCLVCQQTLHHRLLVFSPFQILHINFLEMLKTIG